MRPEAIEKKTTVPVEKAKAEENDGSLFIEIVGFSAGALAIAMALKARGAAPIVENTVAGADRTKGILPHAGAVLSEALSEGSVIGKAAGAVSTDAAAATAGVRMKVWGPAQNLADSLKDAPLATKLQSVDEALTAAGADIQAARSKVVLAGKGQMWGVERVDAAFGAEANLFKVKGDFLAGSGKHAEAVPFYERWMNHYDEVSMPGRMVKGAAATTPGDWALHSHRYLTYERYLGQSGSTELLGQVQQRSHVFHEKVASVLDRNADYFRIPEFPGKLRAAASSDALDQVTRTQLTDRWIKNSPLIIG